MELILVKSSRVEPSRFVEFRGVESGRVGWSLVDVASRRVESRGVELSEAKYCRFKSSRVMEWSWVELSLQSILVESSREDSS